jgi:NTE family protein
MSIPPSASLPSTYPKIALVLGCGGLCPLAAIPMIRFLEDHEVEPDLLVGCSGGALLAALLACGIPSSDWVEIFRNVLKPSLFCKDWGSLATLFGLGFGTLDRRASIFKPRPILDALRSVVGTRRVEDTDRPLIIQSTDFETGEGVEVVSGGLVEAIYASSAAYPFLRPIELGGRWLFDGFFSAPLPILPAASRRADLILALDFSEKIPGRPTTFLDAMVHIQRIFTRSITHSQSLASQRTRDRDVLHVHVRFQEHIPMWEVDAFERILEVGRRAVQEYGPGILARVQSRSVLVLAGEVPET